VDQVQRDWRCRPGATSGVDPGCGTSPASLRKGRARGGRRDALSRKLGDLGVESSNLVALHVREAAWAIGASRVVRGVWKSILTRRRSMTRRPHRRRTSIALGTQSRDDHENRRHHHEEVSVHGSLRQTSSRGTTTVNPDCTPDAEKRGGPPRSLRPGPGLGPVPVGAGHHQRVSPTAGVQSRSRSRPRRSPSA
jgi:hypothetical protein